MFKDERATKQQAPSRASLFLVGFALLLTAHCVSTAVVCGGGPGPQRPPQNRGPKKTVKSEIQKKRVGYSRFSHETHATEQKLACDFCHKFPTKNWKEVRKVDEAFPDVTEYPEHQSCLNCHRQQFFARERPVPRICYNCHINATPVETSRYPFPSLGEKFLSSARAKDFVSDFRVYFPHEKHLDAVSKKLRPWPDESGLFVRASFVTYVVQPEDSDPKSCSVCHQTHQPQGKSDDEFIAKPPKDLGDSFWLKKGTFKTRPTTHGACFTCHNQESELAPLPPNCDACHKLPAAAAPADFDPQLAKKIGIDDWWSLTASHNRFSSGAFRHEVHSDQSCTKCHNVTLMNTVDLETLQVPINSCGGAEGCHVTATTDEGGILNYEMDQRKKKASFVCAKCHVVFGTKPLPASHVEASLKAGTK